MGCCASTDTCRPPNISAAANRCNNVSKSPPPTHPISEEEEEEAVKEVLSETPKHFPIVENPRPIFPSIAPHDKRPPSALRRNHATNNNKPNLSEIYTNPTESAAIATAMAETREINGGELRQRSPIKMRNRPFPGEVKRERIAGMSPGRRSEISPNRSGPGYGRKRENGEVSGRRSRSPVLRSDSTPSQAGLTRTPSTRKTGRSPGRPNRKVEEEKQEGWPPTSNESLENPLVSLECFIFL